MTETLGKRLIEAAKEAIRFSNGEDTGATVYTPVDLKAIRKKQKLSQSKFAEEFGINLNSLKNWEQGKRGMDTTTILFFRAIEMYPEEMKNVARSF